MKEFKNFDDLAVFIINHFAAVFKNHAVLKGGMELKLLGSPRFTNDIDYVFIPYKSKKDIKDMINSELKKLFGENVKSEIHSAYLRYYIEKDGVKCQIEINTAMKCSSIDISTYETSVKNNQQSSIIRAMSYGVSLAHKLAAWNERNLFRDIYDAFFIFSILNEKPDIDVLISRLNSVKIKNKKNKMNLNDFIKKLELALENLNDKNLTAELQDYLPQNILPGLDKKIKIGLVKLADYLKEFI